MALVQKFAEQGDLLKMLNKCGGRMNERAAVQVRGIEGGRARSVWWWAVRVPVCTSAEGA